MSDYYSILGVSKDASEGDIKKKYRQLARENHPDKGGDKEKFQKIQEAYETLSDSQKKKAYDSGGSQPQVHINGGFPFEFNFNSFFHPQAKPQQRVQKKNDHIYTCKITLKDVYFGIVKKIKVQRNRVCAICKSNCSQCNGMGQITQHMQMGPFTQIINQTCQNCSGSGIVHKSNCNECNSKGSIPEEQIFEVNIERGVDTGKQYKFEGWGEQAIKEKEVSGNLLVNIVVEEDVHFKRQGLNLLYKTNIDLRDCIIGKMITIPHFDGPLTITTKGFGIINPNKEYILFDRGLVDHKDKRGNLHIIFTINYPENIQFSDSDIQLLTDTFNKVKL
jgi:DnaJ family protein A protein 2